MKVAVYLRQSQDRTGEALGIDRQREECMRLVTARGWTVVREYIDNDVSATNRKPRPQFDAMMQSVDAGEVNAIVARHMDRLLRRLAELESVLERCEPVKVAIVTASDGIDTSTDGGRTTARILASVAQGESERKRARQLSAAQQAATLGRWVGGRRPFGYDADGVTVRDDEAALVRQGFDDILAGESLAEVARRWVAAGHASTPQGATWNRASVRDVLINPRYAALRRHLPAHLKRSAPELGIVGAAQWPPLVDEPTWRTVARILSDPSRSRGPTRGTGLLTGVAVCGVDGCGLPIRRGAARKGVAAYKCETGKHVSRRCGPIDDYVEATIVEVVKRPAFRRAFAKDRPDISGLLAKRGTLRERLIDIRNDYTDGEIDRTEWRSMRERAQSNLAEVESQIAASGAGSPIGALAVAEDVEAAWGGYSIAQKRATIHALCTVVLLPAGQGARKFDTQTVDFRPHREGLMS